MAASPSRILFAHDDHAFGRTLSWILEEHGYQVTLMDTGTAVVTRLEADRPDLLVLETSDGEAGLRVLAKIRSDERFDDVPVLVLSSLPDEERTIQALGLGASDFMPRPFRVREILARVKAHLRAGRELNRARAEARSRSEMIEILREIASSLSPDEIYQVLVRRVAQGLGISRCSLLLKGSEPDQGVVAAAFENPMLRNLTVDLARYPELQQAFATGQNVLSDSIGSDPLFAATREEWQRDGKAVETTSALAIPFAMRGERSGVFFLRTAGHDAVLNQLDIQFAEQVIRAAITTIEKAYELQEAFEDQRQLRALAETDSLTGLLNRRALESRLARELEQASRYAAVLSCLMIDVDGFKAINDSLGHPMGDRVLAQLANLLKREQRAIDAVARYGGEEFCILLPLTGSGGARLLADRILRRVAGFAFGEPEEAVQVTVSIGIATWPDDRAEDSAALLRLADANLLKAKADGRNRYRD